MTPKEKAIELFDKFSLGYYHVGNAKYCALIAVDEIILSRKDDNKFDDTLWSKSSDMYSMHPMYLMYWQEVKNEIEKL